MNAWMRVSAAVKESEGRRMEEGSPGDVVYVFIEFELAVKNYSKGANVRRGG